MERAVQLMKDIGRIKRVKRSGWVREGVVEVESVADHSYRTAIMAMIFGDQLHVNVDKLISMILLHDLAEGAIGDKVVERGLTVDHAARNKKDQEEIEVVKTMFADTEVGDRFVQLQQEASAMQTREAKILKQLERLEMAVQALEYEEIYRKDLSEFFENAQMHITDPYLRELFKTVQSSRPKKHK